jgi:hypothetical protein
LIAAVYLFKRVIYIYIYVPVPSLFKEDISNRLYGLVVRVPGYRIVFPVRYELS